MSLRTLRIALTASTLIVFGVALLAFLVAPQIGSIYQRAVGPVGAMLPFPTVKVALPLLRVAPGLSLPEPVTTPAAAAVWALVVLGPWAVLVFTLRGPDVASALARWVIALSIYLPFVAATAGAVLVGLLLPFVLL
jgi:hypothetical protein